MRVADGGGDSPQPRPGMGVVWNTPRRRPHASACVGVCHTDAMWQALGLAAATRCVGLLRYLAHNRAYYTLVLTLQRAMPRVLRFLVRRAVHASALWWQNYRNSPPAAPVYVVHSWVSFPSFSRIPCLRSSCSATLWSGLARCGCVL